jgi:hypothetical protein
MRISYTTHSNGLNNSRVKMALVNGRARQLFTALTLGLTFIAI